MATRIKNAIYIDLVVMAKNLFPQIYLAVALLYALIFRFTALGLYRRLLLPVFLLTEPGMLGFYLTAAYLFFERNERSINALSVTPLKPREYVVARAASSGLLSTMGGSLVFILGLGPSQRLPLLIPPLFLSATMFALIGFTLATYYTEFTRFLVSSMSVFTILTLPVITYFGVGPVGIFAWSPAHPALYSFANLMQPDVNPTIYALLLGQLVLYNIVVFGWAVSGFTLRVRAQLEAQ